MKDHQLRKSSRVRSNDTVSHILVSCTSRHIHSVLKDIHRGDCSGLDYNPSVSRRCSCVSMTLTWWLLLGRNISMPVVSTRVSLFSPIQFIQVSAQLWCLISRKTQPLRTDRCCSYCKLSIFDGKKSLMYMLLAKVYWLLRIFWWVIQPQC